MIENSLLDRFDKNTTAPKSFARARPRTSKTAFPLRPALRRVGAPVACLFWSKRPRSPDGTGFYILAMMLLRWRAAGSRFQSKLARDGLRQIARSTSRQET